ncbi:hypothetical protein [Puia dinghuensis]|uniref:Uncharacterized protein n=1 Tax=Puia dinghuensis TaxID=1792502 RepID=A0A8J2UFL5_9BACT|nr:hypothetical protein [Puia dinghuensis]GGB10873.1 hypothetical protein GCM10011511_38050 [Puia dinghuensis]
MSNHQPFQVTGYHSCDRDVVGLNVLNGRDHLKPSKNSWDWLGSGIYFWEQNPERALEYAVQSAEGSQFNKIRIKTPFVLGTTIHLGNCLNLMEPESLSILEEAYNGLVQMHRELGKKMPENDGPKRLLDCAVLKYVHQSRRDQGKSPYDTIRSAFQEGREIYPTAPFTSQLHIQICVINPEMIQGFFLPRPIEKYNPYLDKEFLLSRDNDEQKLAS